MSPEMKEQMMRMAKEQMKARFSAFVQKWLSLPILTIAAIALGALVGALTAFFGQVLLAVSAVRDANPLYWIPGLALIGIAIVLGYKKFGKGTERGMDMVFGVAHGKENEIPLRMIPMVAVSTWLTFISALPIKMIIFFVMVWLICIVFQDAKHSQASAILRIHT